MATLTSNISKTTPPIKKCSIQTLLRTRKSTSISNFSLIWEKLYSNYQYRCVVISFEIPPQGASDIYKSCIFVCCNWSAEKVTLPPIEWKKSWYEGSRQCISCRRIYIGQIRIFDLASLVLDRFCWGFF